ncbi:hypothetical protein [Petrachloros mirabilis]
MPLIWTAITAHGYGHAAQAVPVLNELGKLVPNLKAILRTTVPSTFFQDRLSIPWERQPVQQDIGCIQKGPLEIDVQATWTSHFEFHAKWDQLITDEMIAMKAVRPRVVLADTPYLALCAGHEAGIPTIGLANFTWSEALEPFVDSNDPRHRTLLTTIGESYGSADHALRIAPGLPMPSFSRVLDIGPIAEPAQPRRSELRRLLGVSEHEQVVLIAFGGVPLPSLPWAAMDQMAGYQFVVDGLTPKPSARIHSREKLPFSFKTLLASADIIMTKPGYGTIVEAVTLGLPVIYVRRYNFADEPPLVNYLQRYGRGIELHLQDFVAGNWRVAFKNLTQTVTPPPPPPCTGASEAAKHLMSYF